MLTRSSVHPPISSAITSQPMLFDSIELKGIATPYHRDEEIFAETDPAEYVFKVISGSVRSCRLLSDGRRQINGFYLPGDIFGLELGSSHSNFAEAVGESLILRVRKSAVLKVAERDQEIAWKLLSVTSAELGRSRTHGLLLVTTARERIAGFLLDMAERVAGSGSLELPMSRQDIADYLGLTIETVSRTLTQLAQSSKIQLIKARRIVLNDQAALSALNG